MRETPTTFTSAGLTLAVQIGFVAGALGLAVTNLAGVRDFADDLDHLLDRVDRRSAAGE